MGCRLDSGSGSALVLASRWGNAANRRREGLRAAHEQNAEALADLLITYMRLKSSRGARVSQLTLDHYCESTRRFLVFTGPPESPQHALNQLTAEDFEIWLLTMQQTGLAASSIQRHLYGVRNLMKALVWAGAIASDPSAGVRPPSDATPAHAKKQALSVARYAELLALPSSLHPHNTLRAHRDTLLLELGGSLGLRAAELVGLNAADLNLSEGQVRVLGKGGKGRTVPMTARLERSLRLWLMSRSSLAAAGKLRTDALLVSMTGRNYGGRLTTKGARSIAATYYQALGLAPELWGLHTLRRTAGTHLYRATRDLHVVADVLGHASVNTSAIYAKMDTEVRREAMEAMERMREPGS
ncbi:tyrosine-type recombinase/integrase [Deinococcus arenicola]|uniref:Tyrosine-type recombinase/integrase n=1 Tax=Deinococcus arenicola TaxID=2994950 RepID=A0ABU4DNL5_9DEIO|nr:tyrosine-type recombinase/integrase [Deinococcus sp. ZS9-10]MDV6374031.1 tyrosine-type recombinase/integrase [Deinococcus sp. ZS9-10]